MASTSVSKHINAPVQRIWSLFTDLEAMSQHIGGIKQVEILTPGPFAVGTRWRETRVMFGQQATEEMEVTECDEPRGYVAEAHSHGSYYVSKWTFEPTDTGSTETASSEPSSTLVRMDFSATPESFMAKLMSPLAGVMMKSVVSALNADLEDLARVAEAEGTDERGAD